MRIHVAILSLLLISSAAVADETLIKNPEGEIIARLLDCSSCRSGDGKECRPGAETGFHDGRPCGQCLINANYGTRIPHAYDIFVRGHLVDENGEPLKGRFVRIFMPQSWTIRTRTIDDGMFIIRLGATLSRVSDEPITIDLGNLVMEKDSDAAHYALYMMPEFYKPCPETE